VVRDLEPLNYQVSDARYPALLQAVTAIFDRARSASVPLDQRIAAADALGQAGDLRLDPCRDDYWVMIPASKFLMGAQTQDPNQPIYDAEAGVGLVQAPFLLFQRLAALQTWTYCSACSGSPVGLVTTA
jgi:hypothetical protein